MKTNELLQYIEKNLIPLGTFNLAPGKYELEGGSYYNVDIYTAKDPFGCRYESQKKCIYIQYMVVGEELIYVTDIDNLQVSEPYSEEKDVMFFIGGEHLEPILMTPGKYLIFYPKDDHKPSVLVGETGSSVKKVVFKVKIDE